MVFIMVECIKRNDIFIRARSDGPASENKILKRKIVCGKHHFIFPKSDALFRRVKMTIDSWHLRLYSSFPH